MPKSLDAFWKHPIWWIKTKDLDPRVELDMEPEYGSLMKNNWQWNWWDIWRTRLCSQERPQVRLEIFDEHTELFLALSALPVLGHWSWGALTPRKLCLLVYKPIQLDIFIINIHKHDNKLVNLVMFAKSTLSTGHHFAWPFHLILR